MSLRACLLALVLLVGPLVGAPVASSGSRGEFLSLSATLGWLSDSPDNVFADPYGGSVNGAPAPVGCVSASQAAADVVSQEPLLCNARSYWQGKALGTIPYVAAVVALLVFFVLFALLRCCDCCGGRHPTTAFCGAPACCQKGGKDGVPIVEPIARYSRNDLRRPKVYACVVLGLTALFAAIFVVGGIITPPVWRAAAIGRALPLSSTGADDVRPAFESWREALRAGQNYTTIVPQGAVVTFGTAGVGGAAITAMEEAILALETSFGRALDAADGWPAPLLGSGGAGVRGESFAWTSERWWFEVFTPIIGIAAVATAVTVAIIGVLLAARNCAGSAFTVVVLVLAAVMSVVMAAVSAAVFIVADQRRDLCKAVEVSAAGAGLPLAASMHSTAAQSGLPVLLGCIGDAPLAAGRAAAAQVESEIAAGACEALAALRYDTAQTAAANFAAGRLFEFRRREWVEASQEFRPAAVDAAEFTGCDGFAAIRQVAVDVPPRTAPGLLEYLWALDKGTVSSPAGHIEDVQAATCGDLKAGLSSADASGTTNDCTARRCAFGAGGDKPACIQQDVANGAPSAAAAAAATLIAAVRRAAAAADFTVAPPVSAAAAAKTAAVRSPPGYPVSPSGPTEVPLTRGSGGGLFAGSCAAFVSHVVDRSPALRDRCRAGAIGLLLVRIGSPGLALCMLVLAAVMVWGAKRFEPRHTAGDYYEDFMGPPARSQSGRFNRTRSNLGATRSGDQKRRDSRAPLVGGAESDDPEMQEFYERSGSQRRNSAGGGGGGRGRNPLAVCQDSSSYSRSTPGYAEPQDALDAETPRGRSQGRRGSGGGLGRSGSRGNMRQPRSSSSDPNAASRPFPDDAPRPGSTGSATRGRSDDLSLDPVDYSRVVNGNASGSFAARGASQSRLIPQNNGGSRTGGFNSSGAGGGLRHRGSGLQRSGSFSTSAVQRSSSFNRPQGSGLNRSGSRVGSFRNQMPR